MTKTAEALYKSLRIVFLSELPSDSGFLREGFCKYQSVAHRHNCNNKGMNDLLGDGDPGVIGKGVKRIVQRMGDNAGKQASAPVKDRHKKETYGHRKDHLAEIAHQLHAAAVEQVHNMTYAEGHAGNYHGTFHIVLCHCLEQKSPENNFLQKSHAKHTQHTADISRVKI